MLGVVFEELHGNEGFVVVTVRGRRRILTVVNNLIEFELRHQQRFFVGEQRAVSYIC